MPIPKSIGGSKRRGQNASNRQAAAALAANFQPPVQRAQPTSVQLGRRVAKDFTCDVCGKGIRTCKGTGPTYTRFRRRFMMPAFVG